jgi:glutathione S-transferase
MTESLGMNLYMAQTYGAGKLWPDDVAERAKCIQWTLWAATELEPVAVGRLIELMLKKEHERDLAAVETLAQRTQAPLTTLNFALTQSPYLAGDAFSVADVNVASVCEYLTRTKFDLSPWPAVQKWATECLGRPANVKVVAMKVAV